ncbi:MAG: hypothetical protein JXR83_19410 [Deltaproteobacteria bacterium]|nr:hypothetical protein [Deltaproteobacteria bacterium]
MTGTRRYLYGDSKPFPLPCNFLEMLTAATDASVALLGADIRIERARRAMLAAATRANDDFTRLQQLETTLQGALVGYLGEGQAKDVCEETARRLADANRGAIEQVRHEVTNWRDNVFRRAEQSIGRDTLLGSLQELLVHHELPGTVWEAQWKAIGEQTVEVQAVASVPFELRAIVGVTLPPDHTWAQPIKVSSLLAEVTIHVERERKLRKGSRLVPINLERFIVTQVVVTPAEGLLHLRRALKEGTEGYELRIPRDADGQLTMRPLQSGSPVSGELTPLDSDDAAAVRLLWEAIEGPVIRLVSYRTHLIGATFAGTSIEKLKRPGALGEAIVAALAPLVRELKLRSSGAGELNLKLEVEDGRREELFILEDSITNKYGSLPPPQRLVFADFGLSMPPLPAAAGAEEAPRPRPQAALDPTQPALTPLNPDGTPREPETPPPPPASRSADEMSQAFVATVVKEEEPSHPTADFAPDVVSNPDFSFTPVSEPEFRFDGEPGMAPLPVTNPAAAGAAGEKPKEPAASAASPGEFDDSPESISSFDLILISDSGASSDTPDKPAGTGEPETKKSEPG